MLGTLSTDMEMGGSLNLYGPQLLYDLHASSDRFF